LSKLWELTAIDTSHDEHMLIIADDEIEANKRWEERFGDGGYVAGSVREIDEVEGRKIQVK